MTCDLYRLFGGEGELLYIGISNEYTQRMRGHFRDSDWFPTVREIRIEKCSTREEALFKEREAVQLEKPFHNIKLVAKDPVKTADRKVNYEGQMYFDTASAADYLGITEQELVNDRRRLTSIPYYQPSKRMIRYCKTDLEKMI